jgi:6-pyruvoyltetrahydropterin/6-carboxytetrahydropterin synthase
VAGEKLNEAGVLMDFGELKQTVSEIMTRLDHNFLNELDYFNDSNPPSSENIAQYIANSLQTMLKDPEIRVTSVTAWESENACATYLT